MTKNNISKEDRELFKNAMQDVTPLDKTNKHQPQKNSFKSKTPIPTTEHHHFERKNLSDNIYLSDNFEKTLQPETILSYHTGDTTLKQFRQLKKGKILFEDKLDLHGLNVELAKDELIQFIDKSRTNQKKCILIIHGKGKRHGKFPILKNYINHWLIQIPEVLAFHSALPKHGGAGALYVLLKR